MTFNPARMSVGARLVLGFAAVLALMAATSAVSLSRMSSLKANLSMVTGEDAERLRLANAMRDLARYQAVTLRDAVMQDDFSFKKAELALMKKARDRYLETAALLGQSATDPAIISALTQVAAAQAGMKEPVEKAIDLSMSDDTPGATKVVRDLARPAHLAHVAALDKLLEAVQQASRQRNEQADVSYTEAVYLVIGLSLAALALGLGIAWWMRRSITRPLNSAVAVARAIAAGDLSCEIVIASDDEVGQLLAALQTVNGNLSNMIGNLRLAAQTMQTASSEIASGNADLSHRTEAQASSLQQVAASMEELASTVKSSAEKASQATSLAGSASEVAARGGEMVSQVVSTMQAIASSSAKISNIISVIDGVAFQTNILALNAAVEAARAGEQGRGFAVVASEVRSLAHRSAEAAKEIKGLISDSVEKVGAGSKQVGEAGRTMSDIVSQVQRVSRLIVEISTATHEQSGGVGQVSQAVSELDQVTQQNAALVEESAAAADSLRQQAAKLVDAISIFRLAEDGPRAVA